MKDQFLRNLMNLVLDECIKSQEGKEQKEEKDNVVARVIRELSEIKGEEVDINRPNEVAEFLCPAEEFGKEDKISLYDLLNYLTSLQRSALLQTVAYDMPYFLEKSPMNNKYKALARLECEMLQVHDEAILYYLEHDKYEGEGILPEVLCDRRMNDFLVYSEDTEISYIQGLFQDSSINRQVCLVEYPNQSSSKSLNKKS